MTHEYRPAPEEEVFGDLIEKSRKKLSGAALAILDEAGSAAYKENLAHNYSYDPREYEEAMEKTRIAASKITEEDRRLLTEIVRAGKAVAASIDPDDETPARYKAYRGDVHWYHSMASSMVEEIL